jgi:hypothetical protein
VQGRKASAGSGQERSDGGQYGDDHIDDGFHNFLVHSAYFLD